MAGSRWRNAAPTHRERLARAAAARDERIGLGPAEERYPLRLAEANRLPDAEIARISRATLVAILEQLDALAAKDRAAGDRR